MFKYPPVLIFLLLTMLSLASKSQDIRDTADYRALVEQANSIANSKLDSALILYLNIAKDTEKAGYQQLNWEAKMKAGATYSDLGKKDSALLILQDTYREIAAQRDSAYQLKVLIKLADYYADNYEFERAIIHLLDAQKLMTNSTPFPLRFDVLNTLGQVHKKMKDYTSALKYYRLLETDFFYQLNDFDRFLVFMNIGNVYLETKDYAKTEELYLKAYAEIQKIDDSANLALITYNLGNLYFKQRKNIQATKFAEKALKSYTVIGNKVYIEFCYRLLGALQYRFRNFQAAEKYYLKALQIANEIDNRNSLIGNYLNLAMNYRAWGKSTADTAKYEKAWKFHKMWANLKDSLYQSNLANQALELEKKYETEKKNAKITMLEKDNQLQADELILEQQQRRFMWIVIALMTIIIGVVVYFMVYFRRVNDQLKRQSRLIFDQKEQITDQNIQLQKAVNTQNKLFGIIAHDLRSPLVSVNNFVRLLNYYIADGRYDKITRMAKEMDRKNDQVLELTDNLLNWARSQSGGLTPVLQHISLNEILDECYELYLPVAERKEISLELEAEGNCLLWADRDMVRTICRNLINNALKFTPQKGTVRLNYSCTKTEARVSVSDTGMGISPDRQKRLFNVSKEDVRNGTDGERSSGLGLSVCKEFCEILHGKISVRSQENTGSTFTFTMPLYADELKELAALDIPD
ncbi:tetratricopeptide repeat-containing sensor histidine kinase [Mangrovibacterium lignilyticum]|uniref:tetratricopeptide repeat-containing sensor histidine kinase n=1 Tax=Mangrovibacterium lignilyticum TaxID=2668052 RepID=UPI001968217D|nr:ATP-binding protein [Mangrovibacterium lignilyticum]